MTPRNVRYVAQMNEPELLAAGAMCLGDERLTRKVERPDEARGPTGVEASLQGRAPVGGS